MELAPPMTENPEPNATPTTVVAERYPWTTAEYERLCTYRAAVAHGFYSDTIPTQQEERAHASSQQTQA
jgi:hypothetical protein